MLGNHRGLLRAGAWCVCGGVFRKRHVGGVKFLLVFNASSAFPVEVHQILCLCCHVSTHERKGALHIYIHGMLRRRGWHPLSSTLSFPFDEWCSVRAGCNGVSSRVVNSGVMKIVHFLAPVTRSCLFSVGVRI